MGLNCADSLILGLFSVQLYTMQLGESSDAESQLGDLCICTLWYLQWELKPVHESTKGLLYFFFLPLFLSSLSYCLALYLLFIYLNILSAFYRTLAGTENMSVNFKS